MDSFELAKCGPRGNDQDLLLQQSLKHHPCTKLNSGSFWFPHHGCNWNQTHACKQFKLKRKEVKNASMRILYASRTLAGHRNNLSLALFLRTEKPQERHFTRQTIRHKPSKIGANWCIYCATMVLF